MHPHSTTPPADRFWSKVQKSDDPNACWEWTGGKHPFGYGVFYLSGRLISAHRAAWLLSQGPIPDGLFICHRCDNPSCVRPDHLFTGTHRENMADMVGKNRWTPRPGRACGDRNGTHTHPERVVHGPACPWAKLTAKQVPEIRARYAAGGVSQRELAREYGVSQVAIGKVIRLKTHRRT